MGALLPSWRQQAQRERELELIFRGEQYARAIALYYRKNDQRLPPNMDVLITQHYLRKKFKDPITGEDFAPVGGAGAQVGGAQGGGAQRGAAQGTAGRGGAAPARGGNNAPGGGSGGVNIQAALSGVRSTSDDTSIIVYRNQSVYSQFPFDYTAALAKMGVVGQNPQNQNGGRGRGNPVDNGRGGQGFGGGPGGAPGRGPAAGRAGDGPGPITSRGGIGPGTAPGAGAGGGAAGRGGR
jgi:hypothetical protein